MNKRANALADRLEQSVNALRTLAGERTTAEWKTPVPNDGRSIGVESTKTSSSRSGCHSCTTCAVIWSSTDQRLAFPGQTESTIVDRFERYDEGINVDGEPHAVVRRAATAKGRSSRAAPRSILAALLLSAHVPAAAVAGQSVAQRTPNLSTLWSPAQGVVQFNFIHRFEISDAPLRKITNTPSFQVAMRAAGPVSAGFVYGSNSDLVTAYPNEWEWFTRLSLLSQERRPVDISIQAGWNVAAESIDAELSTARDFGPLRILAAGRAFHHAFHEDTARYALAGGAALRVLPWLTIAADYGELTNRAADEHPAWGAGLQLSIPGTPHSISIHASNVGTGSLEGASRGSHTRWGFEYTVPITMRRYAPAHASHPDVTASVTDEEHARPMPGQPDTAVVTIRNFSFGRRTITINAGDVVIWRNGDPVDHVVVSDGFESPAIEPGREWSHRFSAAGTFTYHCKPHPFMKAEIRVREVKP